MTTRFGRHIGFGQRLSPIPSPYGYVRDESVSRNPAALAAETARIANYGYTGPGKYKLVPGPDDVPIYSQPGNTRADYIGRLEKSGDVTVLRDMGGGWFEVTAVAEAIGRRLVTGFLCIPCFYITELSPGAMLVRQDIRPNLSPVPENGGLSMQRLTRFGQRDIGFPVSPVSRLISVPQSAPTGPRLYQAPVVERFPEQAMLDSAAIRRPVNPFVQQVASPNNLPNVSMEGYSGPGTYRVVAPGGLRTAAIDVRATGGTRPAANTPQGTLVEVQPDAGRYLNSGWLPIVSPLLGLALVQAPGGAGLVRQGEQLTAVDRLRFNRIRPVGPSIRGIGQVPQGDNGMTMSMPGPGRPVAMNDQVAALVQAEWKKVFSDASLFPVIGLPSNNKGVMTLTHTMGPGSPPLMINGLPSNSPLANNALYSSEVSRGRYINLYEIMLPEIPGSNGEPSATQRYVNAAQRLGIDVAGNHYHWTGAKMMGYFPTAVHTQQIGMDPIEFTRRTIIALNAALGRMVDVSKLNGPAMVATSGYGPVG